MTYTQLRRALSAVARHGEDGAPTSVLPVGRWLALRGAGCVALITEDRWAITRLGLTILSHRAMPREKPKRSPRRTPSGGHHQQARSA